MERKRLKKGVDWSISGDKDFLIQYYEKAIYILEREKEYKRVKICKEKLKELKGKICNQIKN